VESVGRGTCVGAGAPGGQVDLLGARVARLCARSIRRALLPGPLHEPPGDRRTGEQCGGLADDRPLRDRRQHAGAGHVPLVVAARRGVAGQRLGEVVRAGVRARAALDPERRAAHRERLVHDPRRDPLTERHHHARTRRR
jgi:hypothetical protein